MTPVNRSVVLQRYPRGAIAPNDFALRESPVPEPSDGQFVLRNLILSMDAGFRQWMNAGAGDNYLPGMQLEAPVQSIVLGQVCASRHPGFPAGAVVSARTAWESYSLLDGSDLGACLDIDPEVPLAEYMATLGPTGMTAFFGLRDIGQPRQGDIVLVSAAGGAVGTVVGQLAKLQGCHCLGTTSSEAKARWLEDEVGYDRVLSRERYPDLASALAEHAPKGLDIVFDNVGGRVLDAALGNLREGARIVLCGAIAQYESETPEPVFNTWELITKRAIAQGFMFSDYAEHFPAATRELEAYMKAGQLRGFMKVYNGLDQAPQAFCDMMQGLTRGKCLVQLASL